MLHPPVLASAAPPVTACAAFTCPTQILVIDRPNGPASILIDTISLLLDRDISVTTLDDHGDALRALAYYAFDLVVVGLQAGQPIQLAILPHLHAQQPERPVLVVGRDLPPLYRHYARTYGAREVISLPKRATDLKALVTRLAARHLLPA